MFVATLLLIHPAPLRGPCTAGQYCRRAAVRVCEGAASEESRLEESRREELERLERCLRVATLEASAEKAESEKNLLEAIAAYEELLALQPPCSPNLREQDAARRALQALHPPHAPSAPVPRPSAPLRTAPSFVSALCASSGRARAVSVPHPHLPR